MRSMSVLAASASFAGLAFASFPALAASMPALVPHRAVYDLQLENADDKSGITGLTGRMVYEFNGSACDGYTTNFRFVTRIDMDEAPQRITDQQTTTFESGDGNQFRFVNKTFVDKELTKEVRGDAKLTPKETEVTITKPEAKKLDLARSQFPTRHMEELIAKAEAGEVFYQTSLFDGSEDADRIMATTVVVGKEEASAQDDETKTMGRLAADKIWPVTIAYFDDKENQEGLPVYRINFKLYRNGITRDLTMDYGDFSMKGKLVNLQVFDQPKAVTDCKK
ncbi:ATP-binding protein [Paramesorhizobium deserti]|uniref:ATP-binding protein n=1 Tax=Paramesorhizobium deserti TaxID=1494590 RepID=A0A135HVZ6_9HYPH|nr:cell envelope integrity EipB family protein [Paramesorhizobium deserti]KXF77373.1 ATP-binding protein [Paramesorhizobium deserti]